MQTFFRLTLLGTFAAIGVAVAVAVALQLEPPKSDPAISWRPQESKPDDSPTSAPDEPAKFRVSDEKALPEVPTAEIAAAPLPVPPLNVPQQEHVERVEHKALPTENTPSKQPPAKVAEERQGPERTDEINALRLALAPPIVPKRPPVANRIEELEASLQRANAVARQNEQLLNETLTTLRQPPSESPRIRSIEPAPPDEGEDSEAQGPETLPPPARVGGGPPLAQIQKNEGDDTLTINVQNSDLREVLKLLSDQGELNILSSKNVKGNVSATLNGVDLDTALKAILQSTGFKSRREGRFVYVGTAQDFIEMDQLKDKIGTRIYRTNYVRASDLQVLIAPMLTERVGKVTVSLPPEVDIPANSIKTGGASFANEEVVMVRDYEAVLVQIDQIVEEVDRRPQQVLIEAMILTVKLDDTNTMGVDFAALLDTNNARLVTGQPLANLANLDVTRGGLKFAFLNSAVGNFITALETVGDTNVVASPKLMCLNKQRAEILIGQQLGYISSTVTETSTTQAVQFLEVGTQLRIRPFISRDGMVRMEVHPELSTGNVRVVGAFTLPDKTVTQVTTNIMCRDGATVVIGGLIREDLGANINQVPLLGNLPWLGVLFRRKVETTSKNEIIVVLTPRIVTEPEVNLAGAQETADYLQRQGVFADKMSPIGKRHYARTHYRMALAAWQAGNSRAALRNINISIQFDPLNLDAIRLRNEITGAGNWATEEMPMEGDITDEVLPPDELLEGPAIQGKAPRAPVKQAQFVAPATGARKSGTRTSAKP